MLLLFVQLTQWCHIVSLNITFASHFLIYTLCVKLPITVTSAVQRENNVTQWECQTNSKARRVSWLFPTLKSICHQGVDGICPQPPGCLSLLQHKSCPQHVYMNLKVLNLKTRQLTEIKRRKSQINIPRWSVWWTSNSSSMWTWAEINHTCCSHHWENNPNEQENRECKHIFRKQRPAVLLGLLGENCCLLQK